MAYIIELTPSYIKKAKKFLQQHPDLASTYKKVFLLLAIDPFHPSLRLHKLQGKLNHLHSISLNMKYRISLEFLISDNKITPIDIGSHEMVY